MNDMSPGEVYRLLQRVEKVVERLESTAVHRAEVDALKEDVSALQEANTWLNRAVIGAMITAVIGSIISAIIGVIIRLPPL